MKTEKADIPSAGSTGALRTGILFLALLLAACFFARPISAAGNATVTEVHNYPGTVDERAPRSVPAGEVNLLDRQQPAYDDAVYELESITVEKMAQYYTVVFYANGGIPTPSAQTVEHGQAITRPADPERSGYDFSGWYEAANFSGSAWDFTGDVVTGDVNLYAKWTPRTYFIVVFVGNGGVPAPPMETVLSGQKATRPPDMTRTNYSFGGWYLAWNFEEPAWDFDRDVVTGNTILYAKWTSNTDPLSEVATEEEGASPVSLNQAISPLSAATVWAAGQPVEAARFTFEEDSEYRVTYHYKTATPGGVGEHTVTELYQNQRGDAIRAETITHVGLGDPYTKTAPILPGYQFVGAVLDGAQLSGSTALIESVADDHTVIFTYRSLGTGGGGGSGGSGSGETLIGDQPVPAAPSPDLSTIPDGDVPTTSAPQTGAHRSRAGIVGAALLLCGLAAGRSKGKRGE